MSESRVGGRREAHCGAVVVAAGSSTRFGDPGGRRKPLVALGERSVLEHACEALLATPRIEELVLVVHAEDRATVEALVASRPALNKVRAVVPGGAQRTDSVRIGVLACSPGIDVVGIHDAARPFVRREEVEAVFEAAARSGAAVLAVAVRDTIKHSPDGEHADRTLERAPLWIAQTPQAFDAAELRTILEAARVDGFTPTDDAALWEHYRGPVTLVPGDASNWKITAPEDLALAEAWLASRTQRGLER